MAKRKREFTDDKYKRWIKEGRGSGFGKNYKPWFTIYDVTPGGFTTEIHGIKVDRQHELMSKHELNYFYLLEFSDLVTDIREQFPLLPIEQTLSIADEIGVEHPIDLKTKDDWTMTTDFLITYNDKTYARTIKQVADLDKRQIELFEIERRYWKMKGVDWGIVTDKEIDLILANNISIIHPYYNVESIGGFVNFSKREVDKLIATFIELLCSVKATIRELADSFEDKFMLSPGTGIEIYKYLIINKMISIDMKKPFDIDKMETITIRNENEVKVV